MLFQCICLDKGRKDATTFIFSIGITSAWFNKTIPKYSIFVNKTANFEMKMERIGFNVPYVNQDSVVHVQNLIKHPELITQRYYSTLCKKYFEECYTDYEAVLVPSCTKAIELLAMSLNFSHGDEVIMSPFNFVGIANALINQGVTLVFADINIETMNICPKSVAKILTSKTKAILVMHYAGKSCKMEEIERVCYENNLILIEDNAQGIHCRDSQLKLLGSFGDFSTISFDSMKNISCGEGGVLLFKKGYKPKVSVCYNNGTNKADFLKKKLPYYEWIGRGSKYYISEYNAAILYPLLLKSEEICNERLNKWKTFYGILKEINEIDTFLPHHMESSLHNGHVFYLNIADSKTALSLKKHLMDKGIEALFHYAPLNLSTKAKELKIKDYTTSNFTYRILRLPFHSYITTEEMNYMAKEIKQFFYEKGSATQN